MIRGSDGYDYEDLTARLLGERAATSHNRILTVREAMLRITRQATKALDAVGRPAGTLSGKNADMIIVDDVADATTYALMHLEHIRRSLPSTTFQPVERIADAGETHGPRI